MIIAMNGVFTGLIAGLDSTPPALLHIVTAAVRRAVLDGFSHHQSRISTQHLGEELTDCGNPGNAA